VPGVYYRAGIVGSSAGLYPVVRGLISLSGKEIFTGRRADRDEESLFSNNIAVNQLLLCTFIHLKLFIVKKLIAFCCFFLAILGLKAQNDTTVKKETSLPTKTPVSNTLKNTQTVVKLGKISPQNTHKESKTVILKEKSNATFKETPAAKSIKL
jgi:hypothetical protein